MNEKIWKSVQEAIEKIIIENPELNASAFNNGKTIKIEFSKNENSLINVISKGLHL